MKRTYVANFNLVYYGEKEEPLLTYFDSILMPALTSGAVKGSGDTKYLLMNVDVKKDSDGEFVLTGLLIKKTILEVKSDIDKYGNLIEKDDKYPTAPFSMFAIYLKNHRMLFVENQKGSPNIQNFKATIKFIINTYVNKRNKELAEEGNKELPIPILNITGIPMRSKLDAALKDVSKIRELKLRFYPLNGDIDYSGLFEGVATDLRKKVGSKKGEILLRSPQNIPAVIEIVSQSEGTVEPIFSVTYNDKRRGQIKNDEISENMDMDVQGKGPDEEMQNVIDKGKNIASICYVSEENSSIYDSNRGQIIPFLKKE